jgi:hypothetical protein
VLLIKQKCHSPKQKNKTKNNNKRWKHLWLVYPIFRFVGLRLHCTGVAFRLEFSWVWVWVGNRILQNKKMQAIISVAKLFYNVLSSEFKPYLSWFNFRQHQSFQPLWVQ